jgi:glutathione-regulated potassium-efflux system ancillary protein KefC
MLISPLLLVAADRWWIPALAGQKRTDLEEIKDLQHAPVIICGFGRYGQIVGRLMYANGVQATVLEHDAETIDVVRRFGWEVYYGDATRLDLLRTAGAEKARVLVVAVDDMQKSLQVVDLAREHFPHLKIVARARNVQHYYSLRDRGVELVERETLDSALMSGRSVLQLMGWRPHQARTLAMRFRRHSITQLETMWPHHKNQAALMAMAKQGRQQLEELFAQERQDDANRAKRPDWADASDGPAPDDVPKPSQGSQPAEAPSKARSASA